MEVLLRSTIVKHRISNSQSNQSMVCRQHTILISRIRSQIFDWSSQIMVCVDSTLPTRTPYCPITVLETPLNSIDRRHHCRSYCCYCYPQYWHYYCCCYCLDYCHWCCYSPCSASQPTPSSLSAFVDDRGLGITSMRRCERLRNGGGTMRSNGAWHDVLYYYLSFGYIGQHCILCGLATIGLDGILDARLCHPLLMGQLQ